MSVIGQRSPERKLVRAEDKRTQARLIETAPERRVDVPVEVGRARRGARRPLTLGSRLRLCRLWTRSRWRPQRAALAIDGAVLMLLYRFGSFAGAGRDTGLTALGTVVPGSSASSTPQGLLRNSPGYSRALWIAQHRRAHTCRTPRARRRILPQIPRGARA